MEVVREAEEGGDIYNIYIMYICTRYVYICIYTHIYIQLIRFVVQQKPT